MSGCVEGGEEGNGEHRRGEEGNGEQKVVQEGSRGPEEVRKTKDRWVLIEKAHDEKGEEQRRLLAL